MREIMFRGKRLDNGEWVYGAFVPDELEQTHGKMVTWGFIRRYRPNQTVESVAMYEVDRKTVGQYTGQKDIEGVEIYEGDIVTNGVSIGVVIWHDVRAMFIIDGSQHDIAPMDDWCELKRIGTIYENPELLE